MPRRTERARSARSSATIRVAAILGMALVLLAGGWLASTLFVSPEQREAAAMPPAAHPILAPVERGALVDEVTVAVEPSRRDRRLLILPPAEGPVSVTTDRPLGPGDEVVPGAAIAEVNGRPILVLPGQFPFYRDLKEADEGADVRQLQKALRLAGFDVRDTGRLQSSAAEAVAKLYVDAGYEPPEDVVLRRSEVLVSSLPATVLSAPPVGTAVDGSASVGVEAGERVGRAEIPPAIAAKLSVGLRGVVYGTDDSAEVVEIEVADDPSANAVLLVDVEFGRSIDTLTVRFETDRITDDALLVPSTAVAHSAERATVVRSREDELELVHVRVIGTLNGRSAIEPIDEGELATSDQVAIE